MDKPRFVYVIYIRATPDEIWNGLIDPEMTRQYRMHRNISEEMFHSVSYGWPALMSGLKTLLECRGLDQKP